MATAGRRRPKDVMIKLLAQYRPRLLAGQLARMNFLQSGEANVSMTIDLSLPPASTWSGRQDTEAERSADGILKLPSRLRRDLIILVVIKLAMLSLLYGLFFSPSHRIAIDTASHIAGQQPR
jgi:hypothetical protein